MSIAIGMGTMTEMRRATWSGLDGRVVLRRDRKARGADQAEAVGEGKGEEAGEALPAAQVSASVDPPSD